MVAADPDHPLADAFDRTVADLCGALRSAGLVDLRFGRRLPALVSRLGLTGLGTEVTVALRHGGGPAAALLRRSLRASRTAVPAAAVTAARFDAAIAATRDPSFGFLDALSVAAWGRRPD